MTDPRATLTDLERVLGPPLDFLVATRFRNVERTRLPVETLGASVAAARGAIDDPDVRVVLERLAEIVERLPVAPTAADVPVLGEAAELLAQLRSTPRGRAGREYRPTTDPGVAERGLARLGAPVASLRGVGPKRGAELERFGLRTIEDVLYHLPFRYEDRRRITSIGALRVGEEASVEAAVVSVGTVPFGRRVRRPFEVVIGDRSHAVVLVWFQQAAAMARRFHVGQRLLVHGKVEPPFGNGPARMVHPSVLELGEEEPAAAHAALLPVYEKPTPMPVVSMRRIVQEAARSVAEDVPAALPASVASAHDVVEPARALRYLHTPPAEADAAALSEGRSYAHRSLAFDELFFLQLGLGMRRRRVGRESGRAFGASSRLLPAMLEGLPFHLTAGQRVALDEIGRDLAAPHPMHRLLQGDVGSGKTVVALAAALIVVEAGMLAALMAPTELLAEQHFDTIRGVAEPLGVRVRLLTGRVGGRARERILAELRAGDVDIVIGTQALIQENVPLERLGLAIVDEQHRFGVMQRAALRKRDEGPALDVLVMSATPIPRTLALTLYGDLDVTIIADRPAGRMPVRTAVLAEARRSDAWEAVRAAAAGGEQAYVVFPLVDDSERSTLRAATTMSEELRVGPLRGLRVGLIHGRMKADEKDSVMRRFKEHELDVLVSTTVIEVGIDVPNATVIVVDHADRFGLAQLHQLRGRVGRGTVESHCLLIGPDAASEDTRRRLAVLEETSDGFELAEADLALRGPGDFLGTRQAGLPPLRIASLVGDAKLLRDAAAAATAWLDRDPELERPESRVLLSVLRHRWAGRLELAQVG